MQLVSRARVGKALDCFHASILAEIHHFQNKDASNFCQNRFELISDKILANVVNMGTVFSVVPAKFPTNRLSDRPKFVYITLDRKRSRILAMELTVQTVIMD